MGCRVRTPFYINQNLLLGVDVKFGLRFVDEFRVLHTVDCGLVRRTVGIKLGFWNSRQQLLKPPPRRFHNALLRSKINVY